MQKLLTRNEAAIIMRCSPHTIINWGKKGIIEEKKIGGKVYVPEQSITKILGHESKLR